MKKRDIILIGAILAVALIALILFGLVGENGSYVIVKIDGDEVARYSLDKNGEYSLNGGTNILTIENGQACISRALCPDGLCMRTGKVHKSGETITCLPNRLTVTVFGAEGDVDIIVD